MHFQSCSNTFQKLDLKWVTSSRNRRTEQKCRLLETALFEMPSLNNHKIWSRTCYLWKNSQVNLSGVKILRLNTQFEMGAWTKNEFLKSISIWIGICCSFKKKFLIDFTQIMLCWTWSHRRGIRSLFSIRHTEFILRYTYPNPYFGLKWLSNDCYHYLYSGANVSIQSKSRQTR